ncbi:2-dehydro-3-deoxygalactonokinase [Pseudooceanicola sp. C21-150M6]|uniref:2-dehydro-3-deoxygalactonokinase n=1 Tax=Pseudooceanicola sp. C21-150M6 TaxID=3434355 RepID=UPI003D7FAE7F
MPELDLSDTQWVAADWGSSNLRLWVMGPDDAVIAAINDPRGAAGLSGAAFEDTLRACLAPVLADWRGGDLPVIACGMVGARQGWAEAAYLTVPGVPVDGKLALRVSDVGAGLSVFILPGMSQQQPADVMRGEETQIAGLLATDPGFDGMLCLPGTHCKWARIKDGQVLSFATCMTGELFALLAGSSVLRHSVDRASWDAAVFDTAVAEALSQPGALTPSLFGIRASALLHGTGPDKATARLSGLLIGSEVGVMRGQWDGRPVAILGASGLSDSYARALTTAGAEVSRIDAETATLRGLTAAYHQMKGQTT